MATSRLGGRIFAVAARAVGRIIGAAVVAVVAHDVVDLVHDRGVGKLNTHVHPVELEEAVEE